MFFFKKNPKKKNNLKEQGKKGQKNKGKILNRNSQVLGLVNKTVYYMKILRACEYNLCILFTYITSTVYIYIYISMLKYARL